MQFQIVIFIIMICLLGLLAISMLEKKWEISESYKGIELKHERAARLKLEGHRDINIFGYLTLSVTLILLIVIFYKFVIVNNSQNLFEKAKYEAMNSDDPFLALNSFREKIENYGLSCPDKLFYSIVENENCKRLHETEAELVMNAIDKNSMPALVFLFEKHNKKPALYPENLERNKAAFLATHIIKLANEASLVPENQKLLMTAGEILQDGSFALQNTQKSISMYIKAWQAGDKYSQACRDAAEKLTRIYESLKDPRSAYFWRIRSMDIRGIPTVLEAGQIEKIQTQATDKNILYITND